MSEGRLVLILGGARGGKSDFAEELAAELGRDVLFVATAEARDEEMRARIAAHQAARPPCWRTLEAPLQVGRALATVPTPNVALLDCLTLLVSNLLGSLTGDDPYADGSYERVRGALDREVVDLVNWQRQSGAHLLIVTNEVGMGLVPSYPLGRAYRDLLGWANRRLARLSDQVYLVVAGLPVDLKRLARRAAAEELGDG
ncbi:MAG: bifunctional adenosylcobinamide kinase/adenosylcobinamide-phosphate guanylyltransferase [Chloroflexi bacterium]|nr:bifunctional adenosylcobinamide kinase/adenosylcobinamide-phosphate guanylyltransferase [Chloroflexota bacterium]MCL5109097.1 bifunctional adenosylcobinamide kinase/adenosylcobinamide-phosphate guanylyltransferase [Chloroflexota bacterium]